MVTPVFFYWRESKNYGLHRKIPRNTVYFTEIYAIISQTFVIFWYHHELSELLFFRVLEVFMHDTFNLITIQNNKQIHLLFNTRNVKLM